MAADPASVFRRKWVIRAQVLLAVATVAAVWTPAVRRWVGGTAMPWRPGSAETVGVSLLMLAYIALAGLLISMQQRTRATRRAVEELRLVPHSRPFLMQIFFGSRLLAVNLGLPLIVLLPVTRVEVVSTSLMPLVLGLMCLLTYPILMIGNAVRALSPEARWPLLAALLAAGALMGLPLLIFEIPGVALVGLVAYVATVIAMCATFNEAIWSDSFGKVRPIGSPGGAG